MPIVGIPSDLLDDGFAQRLAKKIKVRDVARKGCGILQQIGDVRLHLTARSDEGNPVTEYISTWVRTIFGLRTTAAGGLRRRWEVPTPSFFYLLGGSQLGVDLYTEDDGPLNPGESGRSVLLRFWAPVARELATTDSPFVLVYGDRVIGSGLITSKLDGPPITPPPAWNGYEEHRESRKQS